MRAWLAIAVLAGSWLLGLGYFQPASPFSWLCLVAVGVVLLSELPLRLPERRLAIATVPLVVPAFFLAPLPYKVIPLLLGAGVLLCRTPIPRRWPRRVGRGMIAAGAILFAQSALLWCYQLLTVRSRTAVATVHTAPLGSSTHGCRCSSRRSNCGFSQLPFPTSYRRYMGTVI